MLKDDLFVRGDPFTYFFVARLKWSPSLITFLFSLLTSVPIFVGVTVAHAWHSQGGRIGLLDDYSFWPIMFLSTPATVLFFLWLPRGILEVIEGLQINKVLVDEDERLSQFLQRFDKKYNHWIWATVAFCLVALYMAVFALPEHKSFRTWETASSFLLWYMIIFWTVVFWIGSTLILRAGLVLYFFNRLFREFRIDVRVLHPDGAGGLSSLGAFSVKVGYILGIYGLAAVSATLTQSYRTTGQFSGVSLSEALLTQLILYAILAPIAFFAPIGAARNAMRAAKNELLLQISDQFEIDSARLGALIKGDVEELKRGLEKLEQLEKLHGMVNRFPVWPFNTANIVRFFSSISSPFVLWLLSVLVDLLKSYH